jgi:uncharacterized membrane protein YeiH
VTTGVADGILRDPLTGAISPAFREKIFKPATLPKKQEHG